MFAASKLLVMQVGSYDLFLDIDFQNLEFRGRVLIELESEADVILNCIGLKVISSKASGRSFQFEQNDENLTIRTGPFRGRLEVEYVGSIPDLLVGIYRAPYGHRYMITTQFEPAHARRMFPCVDNPDYKAEFKLSVKIDRELDAISNMPVDSVEVKADKKIVSFQKTPRMSTYLLYLGIGRFDEVGEKLGNIDVIAATTPGKVNKARFVLEVAKKSIEFYESYFGIPYMLPKVHLISVPEFAAGAMENWGAITFREAAFQVDKNSSLKTRQRVAEVVAHELAHQWFGNLVTMKWWNDLWLNESFATFMGYKVVDAIQPQWKIWQDFLIKEASGAMARDSLKNTHPIEAEIASPNDIAQIFDEISYGKGACILRMVEAYLGTDDFRKGIENYLIQHKFSNATGKDLWSSLEHVTGKQMKMIMSEWIRKPGYPVITAVMTGGKLTLKQERFLLSGASEKDVWPIPITMKLNSESKSLLLNDEEKVINIEDVKSLKLNIDHTGFYRVHYKGLYDLVWRSKLSALDRWQIIFDAVAFLVAGKMPLDEYLNLIKRYYREEDYLPAHEVSDQLLSLSLIMPSRVNEITREFHRSQLKILQGKDDEKSLALRGVMAGRLAMFDESYAKDLGLMFHDYEKIEPDMRGAVAIAYARAFGNFEDVVRRYRASDSDEERIRLLNALMSFKETSLVALSLGLALSGEVKRQDIGSVVLAATANPDAKDLTWKWLKVNIERLLRVHEGTGRLSQILLIVIPILGIGRVDEVETFFEENKIPQAKKGIEAGMERLKIYQRLVESN
jgi:tricorn protease interacting factor F2/3